MKLGNMKNMTEEVLVTIGEVVIIMKEEGFLAVAVTVIAVLMTLIWMIILLLLASVRVTDHYKDLILFHNTCAFLEGMLSILKCVSLHAILITCVRNVNNPFFKF